MYSGHCCLPAGPAKPVQGLVDILVAGRINFAACNMVTVITEKLQNQSLDDVKFADIIPYQTRSKTKARVWQHQSIQHVALSGNKGAQQIISQEKLTSERPSRSHPATPPGPPTPAKTPQECEGEPCSAAPPAPPKKRHCRSLSAGELVERKWRPRSSKIWRQPIQGRRKCDGRPGPLPPKTAGGVAAMGGGGGGLGANPAGPNASAATAAVNEFSTPPESPIPRPTSSASWDGPGAAATGIPYWLEHATFRPVLSPRAHGLPPGEDKASESSGSVCSFTGSTDSELDRGGALPQRCHSHPSVRKGGKKRRREEELRPKLDLFKMEEAPFVTPTDWPCKHNGRIDTEGKNSLDSSSRRHRRLGNQTFMNKYHTRSHCKPLLNAQPICGLQTIASSPRDSSHTSSIMITPTSSPTRELEQQPQQQQQQQQQQPPPPLTRWSGVPQYSLRYSTRCHDAEREAEACPCSEREEETEGTVRGGEEEEEEEGGHAGVFSMDPSNELDVDQIEQN